MLNRTLRDGVEKKDLTIVRKNLWLSHINTFRYNVKSWLLESFQVLDVWIIANQHLPQNSCVQTSASFLLFSTEESKMHGNYRGLAAYNPGGRHTLTLDNTSPPCAW